MPRTEGLGRGHTGIHHLDRECATMRISRVLVSIAFSAALSGCVIGSGPCLWLQVRHDFVGHVHFREFPRSDGIDTVPILILDKTLYMYAPPQSFHCLAANDVQLVGMA